ncbi:MAG: rhodanese-like domain-containing protein [Bythopirellula sp.]|nr:rhodanese-like domain-containing protein [Bythopirellula sp.]
MNTDQTDLRGCDAVSQVVNIAGYKFARLTKLVERRDRLRELAHDLGLRGTILLSEEGINLFVAGESASVRQLLADIQADAEIGLLDVKESLSDYQPFSRMLVKVKKEIIAFGVPGIDPVDFPAAKISPQELKSWLDSGKPCHLLDVRNDYEVRLGTFESAVAIGVDHFRHFPTAVEQLPEELKTEPIVMFCTGGIRCEKAGPFMQQAGFREVYQLDGGILKYFELCGQDHFHGECFVFDKRVALDAQLRETPTTICFACQQPLSAEEQESADYVVGERCPYCT